eukprot:XP_019078988.1 PREDICTED: uncharacterized protein LOC109123509 [Vitis vinifera]
MYYASMPSSLGFGPAAAVIKEFHTAQTTALCITAANIAPISFLNVPLRSSSVDLHIRGTLAAIGDRTRPHAPLKDSTTLITRLHALSRAGAWSADVIISATVEITNACARGYSISNLRLKCGMFASAVLPNPKIFKRQDVDDCLVNGGSPLAAGSTISFKYANTFQYPLSLASATCG